MMNRGRTKFFIGVVSSFFAIALAWELLSRGQSPVVLPGPELTFRALWKLAVSGELLIDLGRTCGRALLATLIAFSAGCLSGVLSFRYHFMNGVLAPVRAILQGLPPIVAILCLVLWLGSSPIIAIAVVTAVMFPLVSAAVTGALQSTDSQLDEMLKIFQLGNLRAYVFVIIPQLIPTVLATFGAVVSSSIRITVMAELLAAPNGIGAAIAKARTLLLTAELFAWTIAIISCALIIDVLMQYAVRRLTDAFQRGFHATVQRNHLDN
ncbi:MAG: ABC transporter permease [Mycobacteriaceae bacterium]